MNTLSKTITTTFFNTQNDYQTLKKHWSSLVNSPRKHDLIAEHHLLYVALFGRDWRKGFTPVTNQKKLDNGMRPYMAVRQAKVVMECAVAPRFERIFNQIVEPFDGLVTKEMVVAVCRLIADFTSHDGPKEAYKAPVLSDATA